MSAREVLEGFPMEQDVFSGWLRIVIARIWVGIHDQAEGQRKKSVGVRFFKQGVESRLQDD